jgi:YD repeat-containing protein
VLLVGGGRVDNTITKLLLAMVTLTMTTGAASAQQRTYYGASGRSVGRSITDGSGTMTNYDSRGRVISRETTSENQTTAYDAGGRNVRSRRTAKT